MTERLSHVVVAGHEPPATLFMPLPLVALADTAVVGIYKGKLPERMRLLRPTAAASYLEYLTPGGVVSDMFRSAESSLRAKRERRGAQRPGYSGHNYGISIDLDVTKTMKNLDFKTKRQLDEWMAERGWHCHRRDHKRAFEEWHFNYFGDDVGKFVQAADARTSIGLERMITAQFGRWWHKMSNQSAQRCLGRLGMYDGDLDGKLGPLSREAILVFQRAWLVGVKPTGTLDTMTKRTLAYVTADRVL